MISLRVQGCHEVYNNIYFITQYGATVDGRQNFSNEPLKFRVCITQGYFKLVDILMCEEGNIFQ